MRDTKVTLGGKVWDIMFCHHSKMRKGWWGECNREHRYIKIRKGLSLQNTLDTLVHEMRHAQHPVMFEAEEFITKTSTEIAVGLIKTGMVNCDTSARKNSPRSLESQPKPSQAGVEQSTCQPSAFLGAGGATGVSGKISWPTG